MATGIIFDIKEMSVNDGPGIRTTVFFKGCPLNCRWCHNPEGLSFDIEIRESGPPCMHCDLCRISCGHEDCQPLGRCLHVCPQGRLKLCGRLVEATVLAAEIRQQETFLLQHGGVTLSGGEPLAQPDFLLDLMQSLKPLHLAIETSGYAPASVFQSVCGLADLILIDIKHMDPEMHKTWTGVDNDRILDNIRWLKRHNHPFIVRLPLIPGVNDAPAHMEAAAAFLTGAPALIQVELLPCNPLAGSKYPSVGRSWQPGFDEAVKPNIDCTPFEQRVIRCKIL
ncbi:MAG: glycyl-radical enzyme activating protein [Bacillota bacterium]|nr:glycyl-radical enzyme activating protein [Bacillota bacterium]